VALTVSEASHTLGMQGEDGDTVFVRVLCADPDADADPVTDGEVNDEAEEDPDAVSVEDTMAVDDL